MRVQLFSAAAMLAMACTVTAKPVPDDIDTVDQDLHARDPAKSGAEAPHLNTGLWSGKNHKEHKHEHKHDQAGKPSKRQITGACEGAGSGCYGDVTHWDGGLGACGWDVNTETEVAIAMPVGMMGPLSNSNPYCGRSVTIKNPETGATAQAVVGDKCMGCEGSSIDLTNALFRAIAPGCDGRCHGYEWWFN